ncbi:MAG TPA: PTS sugar transporter subunit IIA [Spirochaetota bacterium]|nr:PTS sugar transporter subunit IIA [Spirochaetota bacterium]
MLNNVIEKDLIFINPAIKNKEELFSFISQKAEKKGLVSSSKEFQDGLFERENQVTTELKPGIAIPHAKIEGVKKIFCSLMISKKGIKFSGGFSKGAEIIFIIGSPLNDPNYLKVLGAIARLLDKEEFINDLKKSEVVDDVLKAIQKHGGTKKEEEGKTKYLVSLSINVNYSIKSLSALFLEVGIRQPILYTGEYIYAKMNFGLPMIGFAGMGVKGQMTDNKTIQGICDDVESVSKLNSLLKDVGIDLSKPGVGSLYSVELHNFYGGADIDLDF